jgi:hypothetical protein
VCFSSAGTVILLLSRIVAILFAENLFPLQINQQVVVAQINKSKAFRVNCSITGPDGLDIKRCYFRKTETSRSTTNLEMSSRTRSRCSSLENCERPSRISISIGFASYQNTLSDVLLHIAILLGSFLLSLRNSYLTEQ